jgi:lysophospholipase L1-like esterase
VTVSLRLKRLGLIGSGLAVGLAVVEAGLQLAAWAGGGPPISGFPRTRELAFWAIDPGRVTLRVPAPILRELTALQAVIANAGNPTQATPHDTVLVKPDERLGWALRPNARIQGHLLRPRNPLNLDPPSLFLAADSPISPELARYLASESLMDWRYTIDPEGNRLTLPDVASGETIAIVGDSVAFGVGVDDRATAASQLQRAIGDQARVINAGVGGYSGGQALERARAFATRGGNRALVYLTSVNDFRRDLRDQKGAPWTDNAREVLGAFAGLKDRFSGRVVVVVVAYLEFTFRDLFQHYGWDRERVAEAEALYRELPRICGELGFAYVDWLAIVSENAAHSRTIFSPFGLYADHAHLSPVGNRIVAQEIHAALENPRR